MAQQYIKNPTYVLAVQYRGDIGSTYEIAYKTFPTHNEAQIALI